MHISIDHSSTPAMKLTQIQMQAMFNAKERSLKEITRLAEGAGWSVVNVVKGEGGFGYVVAVPATLPSSSLPGCGRLNTIMEHPPSLVVEQQRLGTEPPTTQEAPYLEREAMMEVSRRCSSPAFESGHQLPTTNVHNVHMEEAVWRRFGGKLGLGRGFTFGLPFAFKKEGKADDVAPAFLATTVPETHPQTSHVGSGRESASLFALDINADIHSPSSSMALQSLGSSPPHRRIPKSKSLSVLRLPKIAILSSPPSSPHSKKKNGGTSASPPSPHASKPLKGMGGTTEGGTLSLPIWAAERREGKGIREGKAAARPPGLLRKRNGTLSIASVGSVNRVQLQPSSQEN